MSCLITTKAILASAVALAAALSWPLPVRAQERNGAPTEPVAPAGEGGQDAAAVPPLVIAPGPVTGKDLDADGKTPLCGAAVRLCDERGKLIAEAAADAAGAFELAVQPAGRYRIEVGRAAGALVLREGERARSLSLVIPKDIALPLEGAQARGAAAAIGPAGGGGAAVMGTVAVGTILGVGITLHGDRGGDKIDRRKVSPPD